MGVLESDFFKGAGNDALEACATNDGKHIWKRENSRGPHVEKIQGALKKLGFKISDPPGVFGDSTEKAVLAYKGPPRNILQPWQSSPDPIVGKRTIASLDNDMAELEGKHKKVVPQFGTRKWRFSFFGNKGFTGEGIYQLFIGSLESREESQNFTISEQSSGGELLAGFKGEDRGLFDTAVPLSVKRFNAARAELNLVKMPGSEILFGSLRLLLVGDDPVSAMLNINQLKDETLGTSVTMGDFHMVGQLRKF